MAPRTKMSRKRQVHSSESDCGATKRTNASVQCRRSPSTSEASGKSGASDDSDAIVLNKKGAKASDASKTAAKAARSPRSNGLPEGYTVVTDGQLPDEGEFASWDDFAEFMTLFEARTYQVHLLLVILCHLHCECVADIFAGLLQHFRSRTNTSAKERNKRIVKTSSSAMQIPVELARIRKLSSAHTLEYTSTEAQESVRGRKHVPWIALRR